ncbi:unnamed protein product [Phaeothamnion confervicola]
MKRLVTVAALAAGVFAVTPASAKMTCSSADMAKMNTMMAGMADGPNKMAMMQEYSTANAAMVKGDMRACNKSVAKIEKMSATK